MADGGEMSVPPVRESANFLLDILLNHVKLLKDLMYWCSQYGVTLFALCGFEMFGGECRLKMMNRWDLAICLISCNPSGSYLLYAIFLHLICDLHLKLSHIRSCTNSCRDVTLIVNLSLK